MEYTIGRLMHQLLHGKHSVFMILSLIHGWASHQLDFVIAYPQAPAEKPLYMRLPQGYHRKGITKDTHVLKLIRNIYDQKKAGRVWNKYLDEGMKVLQVIMIPACTTRKML